MSPISAAVVALVLLAVFGLLGFVWRAWLQRRRTGSTGFRGISGNIGSAEWVAGLGFVISLIVAVVGPVLQLSGVITPLPVLHADEIQIAGIMLALLGIVLTVWAQLDMGDSWRVGVDQSESPALVHTGMFGRVRNPIYTAMLTFDVGIALLTEFCDDRRVDPRGHCARDAGAPSRGTVSAGQTRRGLPGLYGQCRPVHPRRRAAALA